MYHNYFGFTEKPFKMTPDSHFLYSSSQHDAALKTLAYGIHERVGFMILTGEVGTGKTTTIRALLDNLGDNVASSVIINPLLSTLDLIKTINKDFGVKTKSLTVQDHLEALNNFLLENDKNGKNAVVIIDEAQNLSIEALEMARMLSNLETSTHKLLQIILVGQPELDEKISKRELRQLLQRVQIYCRLKALAPQDTANYIQHRIQKAGSQPHVAFEKSAISEVHKVTGGVPRIINTLCELTLLAAYSRDTRVITKNLVQEAAKEVPIYVTHS